MSRSWTISQVRQLDPGQGLREGSLTVTDGRIAAGGAAAEEIDGQGGLLTPGLMDLHIHGMGRDLFEAGPDAMRRALDRLPATGVTRILPTLIPRVDAPDGLDRLRALVPVIEDPALPVRCPGFHLEGPFVAIAGAACPTRDGDRGLLEELLAACGGRVAAMSVSPEVKGILPIIERLREHGVVPFLTHTGASATEAVAAIDAGARHATHFYDVFPCPPERDPGVRPVGVVEAILAGPDTSCDFIADGVHVHPLAIRAALAARGTAGVCLISDATFGAGLPPGRYDTPWGHPVVLREGDAPRFDCPGEPLHGALAGSALTLDRGMRNLLDWIDAPPETVWQMGTRNPARVMGWTQCGGLDPGSDADLVLWDDADGVPRVRTVWCGGRRVFDRETKA